MYVPFTGLGLYGGHRGKRWLRNRIKIFCQFVVPSLRAQSSQDFIIWVSWRPEDRGCKQIIQLEDFLQSIFTEERVMFTYSGVCFWDDKYDDKTAHNRLVTAIHGSLGELYNVIGEADSVLMTIQPSDDCYYSHAVEDIQNIFASDPMLQAFGYSRGYVMDYVNLKIAEWNPRTTPPFYTIKFPREIFTDPFKHVSYAPIKSHEYVKNHLKVIYSDARGFLVGTHGENISTIFNHPFKGQDVGLETLENFGLKDVSPLCIPVSFRKVLMRKLPHGWQRKLRYWFGERLYARIYNFLRS